MDIGELLSSVSHELRQAQLQEREACAKLVEEQGRLLSDLTGDNRHEALISDLARAIRNRRG